MKRDAKQQARFEKIARGLLLTVEQAESLCRAADATWNYIGYDCLTCGGDREMKRAEVIEVVLDADHIATNNRLEPEVKDCLYRYDETTRKFLNQLLKEFVFVYANYGM